MLFPKCYRKCVHRLMAVVVLLAGILVAVPAGAQVAGGTVSGTIVDSSGGVIPNAQISIKNVSTGVSRAVATNSDGFYTAPNLLPGTYEVRFAAQGFKTEVRSGIAFTVGTTQVLNLTMQVGTTTETIQVSTEAPAVELATSDISAVVSANTVRELPLNGRSWTDLATLQPGVDTIYTQPSFAAGSDRGNRGFGQQLTISGARPQQNNYRLDGVSLNDYANGGPGSVLGGNLGVDAIREFSVLTSNYSAEYGKTSGGVVNAITRSGTNQFHGGAYEFLRNSRLDARNFFDGATIPPFKRNQFGGDVGGPIFQNRTFFFADYEGIRQAKGIPQVLHVPSIPARSGMIHDNNTGLPITVTIDPGAKRFLALFPVPNGPSTGPDQALFTFSANQIVNENFVTTRLDHRFSEKDSLFGTYMFDKTPYSSPDPFDNVQINTLSSRQIVAAEETHSFTPSFLNAIRFGYNHEAVNNDQGVSAITPAAADKTLASFAGQNAAQVFIGGGFDPLPGGVGGLPIYFYHWNSFQVYDDAFVTKGTHSIKFGGAVERMLLQVSAFTDPTGIWQFNTLQDFYANNAKRFQGGLTSTVTPRDLRQTLFGAYVQDDWRWKPNLTLNLGLRYEMSTVPTEINGKLANLPTLSSKTAHLGDPFFGNPTLRNFEPRIGFAWDPFRNGKMAVRGGIGMFDVLPLPYQFVLLTTLAAPFFQYTAINNTSATPITFFNGLPSPLPANTLRSTFIDPNPKRNYVMQWNLNVQYELTPNLAAMVAYVGSRGIHQPFRVDDYDLVIPTKTSAGYLWPVPTASGKKINPNFGSVRGMFYEGRSYYDALELQMSKRMSHGFQVQGVYTWGKSIDTSSATVAGDAFGNSISSLHWFDPKLSRGISDFNIGRTLVLNGTWEVPSPKSFSGAAAWPLSGWQLGLIFTASDGVPFTPSWGTGADPLGTNSSDDWDFPNRIAGCNPYASNFKKNPNGPLYLNIGSAFGTGPNCFAVPTAPGTGTTATSFWNKNCDLFPPNLQPSNGPPVQVPFLQCFNLRGNAGRNILIGPGVTETDFSVFKNNYIKKISENFNIQFRAEFFNILNHSNFAPPASPTNTDIFGGTGTVNPAAGALTRTSTTAREIQFALKIIF
jgi:Carboxypeptidase regulatory-like domain/TonB-dependent Receptor Plug Domain